MRRKDREVTGFENILAIVKECKVCRLGLSDEQGIYIVPLNFGYVTEGEQLTLYFHGAKTGDSRKLRAIEKKPCAGFEMDCGHDLIADEIPCANGYRFHSVIGSGIAEFVTDPEEKKRGLAALMLQQTGRVIEFKDAEADSVADFKLTVGEMAGKIHP